MALGARARAAPARLEQNVAERAKLTSQSSGVLKQTVVSVAWMVP